MRRMLLVLAGLLIVAMIVPATVAAKKPAAGITEAVTGTVAGGGTFAGDLAITRFTQQAGGLAAVGTLTGTLTDATGATIGTVSRAITLPLVIPQASCDILHLTLGPLDLDLLGLVVHLDQIQLDITAVPGGGLLGDLLCAVANLLNGGGPLNQIAALLNQILGILQGLGL
jgi:hypothetical protein